MQQSQTIGFSVGDIKKMSGSLLPVGILALVGMLVLPLPVVLLDMFFVFNITISLLILMVALHTHRPLDFSSFPNLLLLAQNKKVFEGCSANYHTAHYSRLRLYSLIRRST